MGTYCICSKKYIKSVPSREGYERLENGIVEDKTDSQRSVRSEGFLKSFSYRRQVQNSI